MRRCQLVWGEIQNVPAMLLLLAPPEQQPDSPSCHINSDQRHSRRTECHNSPAHLWS